MSDVRQLLLTIYILYLYMCALCTAICIIIYCYDRVKETDRGEVYASLVDKYTIGGHITGRPTPSCDDLMSWPSVVFRSETLCIIYTAVESIR